MDHASAHLATFLMLTLPAFLVVGTDYSKQDRVVMIAIWSMEMDAVQLALWSLVLLVLGQAMVVAQQILSHVGI